MDHEEKEEEEYNQIGEGERERERERERRERGERESNTANGRPRDGMEKGLSDFFPLTTTTMRSTVRKWN